MDYEVLSPVLSADEAMKPDAPAVHERLANLSNAAMRPGGLLDEGEDGAGSNIANQFEFRLGDIEEGFRQADIIVEKETETVPVHQGYIEPHAGTAQWGADGKLTIWSSSQGQFTVRDHTARFLGIPIADVKAIPHGDRRGIRRQDRGLRGAGGGAALPQEWPPGQGADVPQGSVRGYRPDLWNQDQGQVGRHQRRQNGCRRVDADLRGWEHSPARRFPQAPSA